MLIKLRLTTDILSWAGPDYGVCEQAKQQVTGTVGSHVYGLVYCPIWWAMGVQCRQRLRIILKETLNAY